MTLEWNDVLALSLQTAFVLVGLAIGLGGATWTWRSYSRSGLSARVFMGAVVALIGVQVCASAASGLLFQLVYNVFEAWY